MGFLLFWDKEKALANSTKICYNYGKLISRTGTSKVIFGYNGRDGVVTEDNGLIYMRARYYSPDMRRFINADIIAGSISNAVTLNRFAYANGNPVSNIDPFGLRAERLISHAMVRDGGSGGASTETVSSSRLNDSSNVSIEKPSSTFRPALVRDVGEYSYDLAIYVSDTVWADGGLPVVGHTRIYFRRSDGQWSRTEFAGSIKEGKSSARVVYDDMDVIPEGYNIETREIVEVPGINSVALIGNFDESVELAKKYANNKLSFGEYSLMDNNCSDYTDKILSVASVDGNHLKKLLKSESDISIPVVRVKQAEIAQNFDRKVNDVRTFFENFGAKIRKSWTDLIP